ncbi:NRK1 [Candida jiufengensis]|uniref:NRK1 n=1 Tax=Candida jiufengensis TaxID=497108 RepID=UPI0022256C08|nr:NRK1 [Candida jiufengensis]KAI5954510.1 NRK1 [Candida jiufengensis]
MGDSKVGQHQNEIVLIAFGGPSSSGKTTVAKTLQALLPKHTNIVHLDDFYLTDSKIPIDPKTGYQNWDCPEALDFDKFKKYLVDLKSGKLNDQIESIQPKDLNLNLNEQETSEIRHIIETNNDQFQNKQLVFVDGFMLFHDFEIIKLFDIDLIFHASFNTLKSRREARAGYNTAEGFWVDPPNYFELIVWPAYEKSHKHLFIDDDIDNRLKPEIIEKFNIKEMDNDQGTSLFDLTSKSLNFILDSL